MRESLFMLSLVFLAVFTVKAQENPVKVFVEQDGKRYSLNNHTVTLKRKPFTLIVEFDQPDQYNGIYINTSFERFYFKLFPSERIPDFEYLPQKVLSEYKFNPNRELKIHPEYFQYLGFNPNRNWFKFNKIERKNGKVIGYRIVENLDLVKQGRRIPIAQNKKELYLFFTVVKKDPRALDGLREIYRFKGKIKFR